MEHQLSSEERERKNRFSFSGGGADTPRSASQPPTTNGEGFYSTPAMQIYGSPGGRNGNGNDNGSGGTLGPGQVSPWMMSASGQGRGPSLGRSASTSVGIPSSLPRSSSFSERIGYGSGSNFANAIRESHSFSSTFEDDESEVLSDATGEYTFSDSSTQLRGRHFLAGDTRSRSQSLATTTAARPLPIGSPPASAGWTTGPLSIPGRFGDIKPPGSGLGSRYGSLGALARSPVGASPSPTGLRVNTSNAELTNISPMARDVGHIMLDEDAWAGNGGESGTTSRRHSVSVVQPRRGIVGFNAPDSHDDGSQHYFAGSNGHATSAGAGAGGLAISDDELAVGLNMLNLNAPQSRSSLPPSQPSSLPIYAPLSRTTHDPSGSLAESLSIPSGEHLPPRRMLRSPSESQYSVSSSGGSPPRNPEHSPALESAAYIHRQQAQRYVPGHGIQYIPEDAPAPAPTSPTFLRSVAGPNQSFMQMHQMPLSPTRGPAAGGVHTTQQIQMQQFLHQQTLAGAPALQRRASQGEGFMGMGAPGVQHSPIQQQQQSLSELGRGIPLHVVPDSWALFIVEFKAGRTDLFYVADATSMPPLRVGDLVIVEADRGKDLGKIVNDTITAAEVETFQRQQAAQQQAAQAAFNEQNAGYGPTSPDGSLSVAPPPPPHGKKEINPKKIYGKATSQDAQMLVTKHQDEAKALALCQTKVKQKKLPMEVIDAEYQWDRRKLTFYFIAEKRIDFRELVRELFRLYKTRIWMASLQGPTSPD